MKAGRISLLTSKEVLRPRNLVIEECVGEIRPVTMLEVLSKLSMSDTRLLKLLETARESADIYLLVTKRQRGCDGMGELSMVKEEFRDSLYDLMNYCKWKGYIDCDIQYNIDSLADELTGLIMQR